MLEDRVAVRAASTARATTARRTARRRGRGRRGCGGARGGVRQASMSRAILASPRSQDVNRLPTARQLAVVRRCPGRGGRSRGGSRGRRPLHGRTEPGGGHRQAGEHERLGQRDQEVVVVDPVLAVQDRGRRRCGRTSPPGRRPARRARARPATSRRSRRGWRPRRRCPERRIAASLRAHVVEVDHHRDRHLHAEASPCARPPRARRPARRCRRGRARWRPPPSAARRARRRTWRCRASGRRRSRPRRRRSPRAGAARSSVAASTVPPSTVQMSALASCGRSDLGDLLALARARPRSPRGRRWRSAGRRAAARGRATAPGPMSMVSGAPTIAAQQRHATSRARARSRVVVDLDPLDRADRRDADAPAAVGVLLEAVLVVELRVALARSPPARRPAARRPPARSASRRCTRPAALGRVERLVDARQQPVAGRGGPSSPPRRASWRRRGEHELRVAAAGQQRAPRPRAGARCRRWHSSTPRAKCSRAHHSE